MENRVTLVTIRPRRVHFLTFGYYVRTQTEGKGVPFGLCPHNHPQKSSFPHKKSLLRAILFRISCSYKGTKFGMMYAHSYY